MLIVKKVKPKTLLSGHIPRDLKVGDKNIKLDKKKAIFLSLKIKLIHLKKNNGNNKHKFRWINLIKISGKSNLSKIERKIIKTGECLVEY